MNNVSCFSHINQVLFQVKPAFKLFKHYPSITSISFFFRRLFSGVEKDAKSRIEHTLKLARELETFLDVASKQTQQVIAFLS